MKEVVNGPLKNEKSWQILFKSRNLTQPTNGSQSLRFCVSLTHLLFYQVATLSILGSDFKMLVLTSWRILDLSFATPNEAICSFKG